MSMAIETRLASLEQALTALLADNQALRADNAELRAKVAGLEQATRPGPVGITVGAGTGGGADAQPRQGVSRRGMMAAVAGAAGGLLLAHATPSAATQGQPVIAGQSNTANAPTVIDSAAAIGLRGVSDTGIGLYGQSTAGAVSGSGAPGRNGGAAQPSVGVFGEASSVVGKGVSGLANAVTGETIGVFGESASTSGTGVAGLVAAGTGPIVGVRGDAFSPAGCGVSGFAFSETGAPTGVRGEASGPGGRGVYGRHPGRTGRTGAFAVFADGRFKARGRSYLATPTTAPVDGDLDNGSISFFLDPANDRLRVRVKYGNGSLLTGSIALA